MVINEIRAVLVSRTSGIGSNENRSALLQFSKG